jgi:Fe2+ transport system protein FeoA
MPALLNLLQMPVGKTGKIVELATENRTILKKLLALGIVPGLYVTLLRNYPGIVIQTGFTTVALDRTAAVFILVCPEA